MSTGADHDSVHRKNDRVLQQASRSDPGDDLDPRLVHRLEPLSLLLGILVRDRTDEVVTPAALIDLARCRSGALINGAHVSMAS